MTWLVIKAEKKDAVCRLCRLPEILLNAVLQVQPVHVCACVHVWRETHAQRQMCVKWSTSPCEEETMCELAFATVYWKVDYGFGSILLTITKLFCFVGNCAGRPMCSCHCAKNQAVLENRGRFSLLTCRLTTTHYKYILIVQIFSQHCPQTEALNILALDDGPAAPRRHDQTHQTSRLYKQEL